MLHMLQTMAQATDTKDKTKTVQERMTHVAVRLQGLYMKLGIILQQESLSRSWNNLPMWMVAKCEIQRQSERSSSTPSYSCTKNSKDKLLKVVERKDHLCVGFIINSPKKEVSFEAERIKYTFSKSVFCLFAREPMEVDCILSVSTGLSWMSHKLGKRCRSLAAEDSMATIAACRKGRQRQEPICACCSAHPHGNKQETWAYSCFSSSGKLLECRVLQLTVPLQSVFELKAFGCLK